MAQILLLLSLTCLFSAAYSRRQADSFRFANYYGDHMVLQRAPARANVWGFVEGCEAVKVDFNGTKIDATIVQAKGVACRWVVSLPATSAVTPFTITATAASYGNISISDVLFGDVWVCSGQSNMQFTLPMAFNASAEEALADKYPNIRLFTAALVASETPQTELLEVEQVWTPASSKAVGGGEWTYFSAVCWLYGRDIYDHVGYPIGLVDTDWGGTPVEAWSSPDALAKCNISIKSSPDNSPSPGQHSVLWNAMIHPFLNMTIKGAIWYQGEANAGAPDTYNCTFPTMVDDWREKWYNSSRYTDELFPFGFVQLAAYGTDNSSSFSPGFPVIRWAQTANYGFVPNPRQKRVFMAVAMDLGDPDSPYGSIHPRDKQDVAARLALAGRAIAYDDPLVYYTGPIAVEATLISSSLVRVEFTSLAGSGLELRYSYGFEVGCSNQTSSQWIPATVIQAAGNAAAVGIPECPAAMTPASVRYCWRTDPCSFKKCPIYSGGLPSGPFVMPLGR